VTSSIFSDRDISFFLYEFLDVLKLTKRQRYADHNRETFDAALATARKIATEKFAPHFRKADLNEPFMRDGKVVLIPEIEIALQSFSAAGLMAAHADYDLGGMQLPWTVAQACYVNFHAANVGTFAYAFLTIAAANLLKTYGSPEQQSRFLVPMQEGRFFGTMALSEPQAGSSLADIRTLAEPHADGYYRIHGSKMWTSGGEHELSENIIHLVLARILGSPSGAKGLSLFIVPRYWVEENGTCGASNDVALAGLNHKMGWRGTVNTAMSFGENGNCRGWLVGNPNEGLSQMFHMMNEARIVVGMSAAAMGYAGFRYSADYARTRLQGQAIDTKISSGSPVAIIRHPDVKRMLLAQKAYSEGALALGFYLSWLIDEQKTSPDKTRQSHVSLLLDLLTPVMKAWSSDYNLAANSYAIQILGGYGFTRDFPVEQIYRDNRLNPIHEGTNGIQGLDLLGRKVTMQNGAALLAFEHDMSIDIHSARHHTDLAPLADMLAQKLELLLATTKHVLAQQKEFGASRGLAHATLYLDMFGRTTIAWMWLKQAAAASPASDDFRRGKLAACRYFFRHELSVIDTQAKLLSDLDTLYLETDDTWL
jgi:butyryl-CoA dehydrogenase